MADHRLTHLGREPGGPEWLERLPRLVRECADRWSLDLGASFEYAHASLVFPAVASDGTEAVLKIGFPHRESEHEARALEVWDGEGAVRLLAFDADRHAFLIERCRPGTPLKDLGLDPALDVMIELLPRLWKPVGAPFRPLAEEAAWWASYMPDCWERAGRRYEREVLDAALEAIDELAETQGEQVLLHQDFHADNVLAAEREPWLVTDPKPLAGEREFGIAALVRGRELGHSAEAVRRRLDRLTQGLGLDRERARRWTIAQTLAWGVGVDYVGAHDIAVVRWLLQAA